MTPETIQLLTYLAVGAAGWLIRHWNIMYTPTSTPVTNSGAQIPQTNPVSYPSLQAPLTNSAPPQPMQLPQVIAPSPSVAQQPSTSINLPTGINIMTTANEVSRDLSAMLQQHFNTTLKQ